MARAVRYTRTRGGRIDGQPYREMSRNIRAIVEEELTIAGRNGAKESRDILDASGTGRSWSPGPWGEGGTGDRVASDKMRDSLTYRIIRGEDVGLDVGWTDVWEAYFGYQDVGFSATGFRRPSALGDAVRGMGIMAHLSVYMRKEADVAMDKALRRINNGL